VNLAGVQLPMTVKDVRKNGLLFIRPEHILISESPTSTWSLQGTVEQITFAGSHFRYFIMLSDGQKIQTVRSTMSDIPLKVGEKVFLSWDLGKGKVFEE
jgi:ABC-type Fe3+/spermidine/putrescine transport system ATPase subunit